MVYHAIHNGIRWCIHAFLKNITWCIHAFLKDVTWNFQAFLKDITWCIHAFVKSITWLIHGFLISYKLERTISNSNVRTNKHRNEEKIGSENSISVPMPPGSALFFIWLFDGAAKEGKRQRQGGRRH